MKLFRVCKDCGKIEVLFYERMGLPEHLLLSILTVGVWLPCWPYLSWSYRTRGECLNCGRTRVTLD